MRDKLTVRIPDDTVPGTIHPTHDTPQRRPDTTISDDVRAAISSQQDDISTDLTDTLFGTDEMDVTWYMDPATLDSRTPHMLCTVSTGPGSKNLRFFMGEFIYTGRGATVRELLWNDNRPNPQTGLVVKCIPSRSLRSEDRATDWSQTTHGCCLVRQRAFGQILAPGTKHRHVFLLERAEGDFVDLGDRLIDTSLCTESVKRLCLSAINQARAEFACLVKRRMRYFDIKPGNLGYRVHDGRLQVIILDLGSITAERGRLDLPPHTYLPPEWSDVVQRHETLASPMRRDSRQVLSSAYAWMLCFCLLRMLAYNTSNDAEIAAITEDVYAKRPRGYANADRLFRRLFPSESYGDVSTGLAVDRKHRKLQLHTDWLR